MCCVQYAYLLKLALTKKIDSSVFEEEEYKDDGDAVHGDPYREERPKKRKQKQKKKVGGYVPVGILHDVCHHIPDTNLPPFQKKKSEVEEDDMETCRHCDMTTCGVTWCGTPPNVPEHGEDEEDTDEEDGEDERARRTLMKRM